MQGLLLHSDRRPPLKRGTALLPIKSWKTGQASLRVLRAASRRELGHRLHFLTLLQIPDDHPVAIVEGNIEIRPSELEFHPLAHLPREDRILLQDALEREGALSDVSSASSVWSARIVIGSPLTKHNIKWTKDLRLLEASRTNTSTKRR